MMKNINFNKKVFAVSAIAAFVAMNVQAAEPIPNQNPAKGTITGGGQNNLAIMGTIKNVNGEQNNLAIGYDAVVDSSQKVGKRDFEQAIAIGASGTLVTGSQSIAIGGDTHAKGYASVVIGGDDADIVYDKDVKIDYANPDYNGKNDKNLNTTIDTAFHNLTGNYLGGDILIKKDASKEEKDAWIKAGATKEEQEARAWHVKTDGELGIDTFEHRFQTSTADHLGVVIGVKSVSGVLSLALGTAARAEKINAVAIGTGATATLDNAVALGGGSNTKQLGTKQSGVDLASMKFRWAGGDRVLEGDIVSFGSENYERQLKHVAPGAVSETSTDAINGSQLWSITRDIVDRIDVPNSIKTTVRTDDDKDTTNTATQVYVLTLDQDATEKARLTAEESTKLAHELKEKDPTLTDEQLEGLLKEAGNAAIISDRVQNRYAGRFATAHNVADMINAAGFSAAIGNDASDFTDQNYVDKDGNKLTAAAAINAGDAVKFNSGKNLRIQQKVTAATDTTPEQIEFTYALSDQIDLGDKGTIKLGGTTTKGADGKPVTTDAITLGKDGINAGNKTISGVKDGVDGKDAVNVDQLKEATDTGEITKDGNKVAFKLTQDEKDEIVKEELRKVIAEESAKIPAPADNASDAEKQAYQDKVKAAVEARRDEMVENAKKAVEAKENSKLATAKNVAEMINHATERGTISKDEKAPGKVTSDLDGRAQDEIKLNAVVDALKKEAGNENLSKDQLEELANQKLAEKGENDYKTLAEKAVTDAQTANKEKLASVGNVAEMINAAGFNTKVGQEDIEGTDKVVDKTNGEGAAVNAGDEVTFKAGQNLRIKQKVTPATPAIGDKPATPEKVEFTYALSDQIDLGDEGTIKLGGKTTTKMVDGKPVTETTGAITLGKDGINAGGKTISGVKAGEKDTDAVNVSQLKALEDKVGAGTERGTIETDGTGVKFELGKAEKEGIIKAEIDRVVAEIKDKNPAATEEEIKAAVEAKTAEMENNIKNAIAEKENTKLASTKNVAEMINHATQRGSIMEDPEATGKVKVGDSLTDEAKEQAKIDAIAEALKGEPGYENKSDDELKAEAKNLTNDEKYLEIAEKAVDQAVKDAETSNKEKLATAGNVADMINAAGFNATIGKDKNDFADQAGKPSKPTAINAGDDVIFQSGKNLKVKQEVTTANGKDTVKFTYALEDKIDLGKDGSLTIGGTRGADGKLVDGAKDAVTIGKDGINAGDKQIKGVAAGTEDTDAVNVKQLKQETERGEIAKDGTGVKFNGLSDAAKDLIKEVETAKIEADETKKVADAALAEIKADPANQGKTDKEIKQLVDQKVAAKANDIQNAVTARQAEIDTNVADAIKARENSQLATAKNVTDMINHATARGKIAEDKAAPGKVTAELTQADKDAIKESLKQSLKADPNNAGKTDAEIQALVDAAAPVAISQAEEANKNKLASVSNVADMINAAGFNATIGKDKNDFADQAGKPSKPTAINAGDDVIFQSGKNLKVKQEVTTANGKDTVKFTYALADNIDLGKEGSLTIGGTRGTDGKAKDAVIISKTGINAGGKKITNVAPGTSGTDAVNKSQLDAVENKVTNMGNKIDNVNNRINKLDKTVRGVGASAAAAAALPQVYIPGKSLVAASVGGFKGSSAVAVGYSRTSDSGKTIIKLQGTANSEGDISGGAGIGFLW